MGRTINIGIVSSPWLGGSGIVGSELVRYLSKKDKYKVVYIGDNLPFKLNKGDAEFYKIEKLSHALFTHPLSEASLTEGIVDAVVKYKLDIIHAHFAIPFAHCAIQAKEILKKMGISISVVTTLHGTDVINLGQEAPSVMRHILEQSDTITAVSMDLAMKAKKIYGVRKEIYIIHNFIDFSQFSKLKSRHTLRGSFAKKEEKIFVHISNFRPIKRVHDTLKVFSEINSEIPSVLLMIGEGPDTHSVKKMAQSYKNKKSIFFMGRVKNPYKYLKFADGLIVTSEYESFCLAALEAMAIGVPVFATRVGGLPEVVYHKKTGYLAKLGDIKQLASYIKVHFKNDNNILLMRKNASAFSKNFTAEKIITQYEELYNKLKIEKLLEKQTALDKAGLLTT